MNPPEIKSPIVIYQSKDGQTKLDVRLEDETVWLSQDQMAELYNKAKSTINEHIKNVYQEGELAEKDSMRKFGISEFSTKPTNYFSHRVHRGKDVEAKLYQHCALQERKGGRV